MAKGNKNNRQVKVVNKIDEPVLLSEAINGVNNDNENVELITDSMISHLELLDDEESVEHSDDKNDTKTFSDIIQTLDGLNDGESSETQDLTGEVIGNDNNELVLLDAKIGDINPDETPEVTKEEQPTVKAEEKKIEEKPKKKIARRDFEFCWNGISYN